MTRISSAGFVNNSTRLVFNACPRYKLMVIFLYSAGLRVSELLSLKVKDLQLDQSYGWVRQGKGAKDRMFIIAENIKSDITSWIQNNGLSSEEFLFSNKGKRMSSQTVRLIIKKAMAHSGIPKKVHPHTLRHSFATHLLENGYSVMQVQPLLGHQKIETTLTYTHLAQPKLLNVQSPYDSLYSPHNSYKVLPYSLGE